MTGKRVAMLISSGYGPDVRVQKEAHTLALAGYRVTVIAWDRLRTLPAHTREEAPPPLMAALGDWGGRVAASPEPVTITRVQTPAGYRTGLSLARRMPVFWWRAWVELRRIRPDIIHANDLDTLPLAYAYARMSGIPLIFDAREYYPGMVRANVGPVIGAGLDWLDRFLAPRADAVITVGERLANRYRALGARVTVVHNSQPLPDAAEMRRRRDDLRAAWGIPEDALLVVYVGYLAPDRLLMPMLEAVQEREDVWFAVGGTGPQADTVRRAAEACPRILPLGWIPLAEVPATVAAGDVVYYGLDDSNANSHYFMPNLAFFAFAVGRPLFVLPVGEIAEVVRRERCGIVMDSSTVEAAVKGLDQLCDYRTRDTLTNRAQWIGKANYHWALTADSLLGVYSCMADVKNCSSRH